LLGACAPIRRVDLAEFQVWRGAGMGKSVAELRVKGPLTGLRPEGWQGSDLISRGADGKPLL